MGLHTCSMFRALQDRTVFGLRVLLGEQSFAP